MIKENEKIFISGEGTKSEYLENDCEYVKSAVSSGRYLTCFKKKSTFKNATDTDFWYSATSSKGDSIICKFKNELPQGLGSAFIILDIMGNFKKKEVEYKGENYTNYTYYINSCVFSDCPSEELPF